MSDQDNESFVQESLEKWGPRFVANGIDHNDLSLLRERIDGWEGWCREFAAVGDEHAELGEAAFERGNEESAGEHLTRAAMYYHFGSHVWHEDEDFRSEIHRRAVDTFVRGGQYLDPPVERIEAPYDDGGFNVPGNLRIPDHSPSGDDSPLVILLPGSDSIKEELSAYDPHLHRRGLATLAVDGGGQGETRENYPMGPDYHHLISAVVDRVQELDPEGVDTSKLGMYGVSLGGFYAPYVAAHDDRFDACVGISGKFTVGPASASWGSDLHKDQYQWACKTDSEIELDEITEAMTLRNVIDDLTAPVLQITGAHDVITPPTQTERIVRRAPEGEFLLYEDGNHVCNNIPYKYRPRAADWIRDQLV